MWPSVIYSPALLFIFSSSPAYDDDDKRDSSHAFFSFCLLPFDSFNSGLEMWRSAESSHP
jgi:hypothetical protein